MVTITMTMKMAYSIIGTALSYLIANIPRPVLLPHQQAKLARGAKDKEHAMSQTPDIHSYAA